MHLTTYISTVTYASGLQVWTAPQIAGVLPHMVYARIDAARFASVYSAKGRWSLIEDLTTTATPLDIASDPLPVQSDGPSPISEPSSEERRALSHEAVRSIVHEAAVTLLGALPEGESEHEAWHTYAHTRAQP